MEGKEAIITRIIDDANAKAQGISKEAKKSVDDNINDANEWVNEYNDTQKKGIGNECAELIERRKTVGELDRRKILLKAKQEVLEEVFDMALEKLCSIPKAKYIKIVEKLISEYAEKGDKLILSKDSVLSKEDVVKMPVFVKMKLEFSGKDGDFKGGFKLINDECDKDLSFDSILQSKKQDLESEVAEMLFN